MCVNCFNQKNGFHDADPPFFKLIASSYPASARLPKPEERSEIDMQQFAKFSIMGRVGSTKKLGSVLKISIASEYGRTNEKGESCT